MNGTAEIQLMIYPYWADSDGEFLEMLSSSTSKCALMAKERKAPFYSEAMHGDNDAAFGTPYGWKGNVGVIRVQTLYLL